MWGRGGSRQGRIGDDNGAIKKRNTVRGVVSYSGWGELLFGGMEGRGGREERGRGSSANRKEQFTRPYTLVLPSRISGWHTQQDCP